MQYLAGCCPGRLPWVSAGRRFSKIYKRPRKFGVKGFQIWVLFRRGIVLRAIVICGIEGGPSLLTCPAIVIVSVFLGMGRELAVVGLEAHDTMCMTA